MNSKQQNMLQRVRALLAKAESTQFEAEALALNAKAQELIATYAIDMALLGSSQDKDQGAPVVRIVKVQAPYAKEKALLLSAAAKANNCKMLFGGNPCDFEHMDATDVIELLADGQLTTVVGFAADIEMVDMLFTSLLVQAASIAMKSSAPDGRTRSYRRAFLIGFASAVSERLETTTSNVSSAAAKSEPNLLPVLANKKEKLDDFFQDKYPDVGTLKMTMSNRDGYIGGQKAGRTADVGNAKVSRKTAAEIL